MNLKSVYIILISIFISIYDVLALEKEYSLDYRDVFITIMKTKWKEYKEEYPTVFLKLRYNETEIEPDDGFIDKLSKNIKVKRHSELKSECDDKTLQMFITINRLISPTEFIVKTKFFYPRSMHVSGETLIVKKEKDDWSVTTDSIISGSRDWPECMRSELEELDKQFEEFMKKREQEKK